MLKFQDRQRQALEDRLTDCTIYEYQKNESVSEYQKNESVSELDKHMRIIVSLCSSVFLPLLKNKEAGETQIDIMIVFRPSAKHINVTESDILDRIADIVRLSKKGVRRHHSGYKKSHTEVQVTVVRDLSDINISCDKIGEIHRNRIMSFFLNGQHLYGLKNTLGTTLGFFLNAKNTIPCSLKGDMTYGDLYGESGRRTLVGYYGGCIIRRSHYKNHKSQEPILTSLYPDNIILYKIECAIDGRTWSKLKLRTAEQQIQRPQMKKRMRYLLGHDTDDMVTKITEVQAAQVSEMMSMLAFFKMLKDDVMPYIAPAYRPIALNH